MKRYPELRTIQPASSEPDCLQLRTLVGREWDRAEETPR
jgi:hypothetical protein